MVGRAPTLQLYREMLRASRGFTNYNFREYALRKVRSGFQENAMLTDGDAVRQAYQEGRVQLQMLKRQSVITQLFPQEKHVMENPPP